MVSIAIQDHSQACARSKGIALAGPPISPYSRNGVRNQERHPHPKREIAHSSLSTPRGQSVTVSPGTSRHSRAPSWGIPSAISGLKSIRTHCCCKIPSTNRRRAVGCHITRPPGPSASQPKTPAQTAKYQPASWLPSRSALISAHVRLGPANSITFVPSSSQRSAFSHGPGCLVYSGSGFVAAYRFAPAMISSAVARLRAPAHAFRASPFPTFRG
jgi:hypothetical protein